METIIVEREMTAEEIAGREAWEAEAPARELELAREVRRQAYQRISDPIYMQWKRGQKTEQEWLDAVAQVEADYPLPGVN